MLFSTLIFLFGFLPLLLALYYSVPSGWRNTVALAGSLVFYAWGEPRFALLLLGSGTADYVLSLAICRQPAGLRRHMLLSLGLAYNLGALAYCKYGNFFVDQFNSVLGSWHFGSIPWTQVVLPLGISFFTFQKITYLVDTYRGAAQPTRSLRDYLLYITLFPHLIAGPIIRFHDLADQITSRKHTSERFTSGLWRFSLGLGRKVLLANPLGQVADQAFVANAIPTTGYAWLGLACYTLQIYCDFAAYSDMAVGLARLFGFEFCENFRHPYTALGITDFWRRWHCSLSTFMRDYLYIPLGGNRVAKWRQTLNLWTVFLVSGFWHGANWTFLAWGAYHGALLSAEKIADGRMSRRIHPLLAQAGTLLLVSFGWVLFRADSMSHALAYASSLIRLNQGTQDMGASLALPSRTIFVLCIAVGTSLVPEKWWDRTGWTAPHPASNSNAIARFCAGVIMVALSCAALANQSYNPFIYFRF
jgi:alginate O-acetyltransferase complex protein AlgI